MSRESVIAYFQERFGEATFVSPAPYAANHLLFPDVYAIPPCAARSHWILFTVGASVCSVEPAEPDPESGHVELMMSLSNEWSPGHTWPVHVLRWTAKCVVSADWPVEGFILLDEFSLVPDPERVHCLVVAPSRQLEAAARLVGVAGDEAHVYATYGLTYAEFQEYRMGDAGTVSAPEVIRRWRDMLDVD